jgi:hypothetical protein
MTNNPHALSLETLFFPNPQPLLPLSQVVQDECPPPRFALNSSELLSSGSLGKNPYRHQKVLVSNLGLTVFVKHQVNWLNRFHSLPSGKEKKKTAKRQKPQVSIFALYQSKSLQMLSLSLSL